LKERDLWDNPEQDDFPRYWNISGRVVLVRNQKRMAKTLYPSTLTEWGQCYLRRLITMFIVIF
jgi:hypothetical protein